MKIKRFAALLLALMMSMSMLAACGQVEDEPIDSPEATVGPLVTDAPETTAAPATTTEPVTEPPITTPPETTTAATTTTSSITTEATTKKSSKNDFTVEEMSATMYTTMSLNVRKGPSVDFGKLGALAEGDEIKVTGRASTGWYRIEFKGSVGYVSNLYVSSTKPSSASKPAATVSTNSSGEDEENFDDSDEETENYVDDPGAAATVPSTPSLPVTNLTLSQWTKDNACEYMAGLFTEQRYIDALTRIASAIVNHEPTVYVGDYITSDEAYDIAGKIIHILGAGYCYFDRAKLNGTTFTLLYYVDTLDQARNMQAQLENQAAKIIDKCSGYSDYNKVKYIYEYLCKNTSYGGARAGSSYGPIVDGAGTCLGYAKATFYLLSKAGLDVVYDVGKDEEMHAWVKVKIGGKWYNVDTTWGDPNGNSTKINPSYLNYDFLCVTDDYIRNTRVEVYNLTKYYSMPSATSNDLNWYVLNGYYCDTVAQGEAAAKKQAEENAKDTTTKYTYIRLQFSNEDAFNAFYDKYGIKAFHKAFIAPATSKRKGASRYSDYGSDTKHTYSITYTMELK